MNCKNPVIEVSKLVVDYGRSGHAIRAVDRLDFTIEKGECVGFIGANGAGKSSTIKAVMGFIKPAAGEIRVFGLEPGSAESRRHVGYLPEVALYYPFMKARELLELYGGLHGLSHAELKKRIPEVLHNVGLDGKSEILLKEFSKGMQQRLGIAQALISEPDLLILDEMSSGLDPLGRHDLRVLLLKLKEEGRTIFFSSHELTEVEALCDRVLIIHQGRLVQASPVQELVKPLHEYRVQFSINQGRAPSSTTLNRSTVLRGERFEIRAGNLTDYAGLLKELSDCGCEIHQMEGEHFSLEDYFIQLVRKEDKS